MAYEIEPARVINELSASVWVRSNRTGLQVMMRLVFPRTFDESSQAPITRLIRGDAYQQAGEWQRLDLNQAVEQVARLTPILRSQFGSDVDVREAYVDMVVINAYGGAGLTHLWIDDLEVTGHVPATAVQAKPDRPPAEARRVSFDEQPSASDDDIVALQGNVLLSEGRPFFVRAIDFNGEPFETLQALGFNTIRLRQPATTAQLTEARRLRLKLLAPPPQIAAFESPTPQRPSAERIGPIHDPVLAWDLGEHLGAVQLETSRSMANNLRRVDPLRRPLWSTPDSDVRAYSRIGDIVCFQRSILSGSFELTDYGPWLLERSRLARPGAPFWASVQTELSLGMMGQIVALSEGGPPPIHVQPAQIRLLAMNAVASGARALLFQSSRRLDSPDAVTQTRAAALRKINLELAIIEAWAGAGKYMGEITSTNPFTRIAVLETERSRLAIVMRHAEKQQYTMDASEQTAVSLVDPGSPVDATVFQVSMGGLAPLRSVRRSGGVRVSVADSGPVALVLFSQNPLTPSHLTRLILENQVAGAKLDLELTAAELKAVEGVDRVLAQQGHPLPAARGWMQDARANLAQAEQLVAGRDYRSAQVFTARAGEALARTRRAHWNVAAASFAAPAASPLCASFDTLPDHWRLANRMQQAKWSPNILAGGQMETLDHLLRAGWRHYRHEGTPLQTSIEVSTAMAKGGNAAVRMRAWAPDPATAPAVIETPPIWVVSSPTPLRAGQMVRIHAWVFLQQDIEGSREGLVVFDSLGGPDMGQRITSAGEWVEVTLYRRASEATSLNVTFALTGMGEAWFDEVTVEPIDLPGAAPSPLPPEEPAQTARPGFFQSFFPR